MQLRKLKRSAQEMNGWGNKQSFRSKSEYKHDPFTGEDYTKKRVSIKCSVITHPRQSWRTHE